ncbi:primosomal protein N' [Treponema parvum]|uniref:Replication restart protein PriA n=1 Tax=Treponema parvum TaxID=138851 RepID=A0A975EZA6_9SPIR|nr:primosomal protein N' [Treponema parvum]QTQ11690.1 primosomal protein N' [Treponema parvum]
MLYLDIAVNVPINQTFTYSFQEGADDSSAKRESSDSASAASSPSVAAALSAANMPSAKKKSAKGIPEVGKRAEIRFGSRKTTGFIVAVHEKLPQNCPVEEDKIKPVIRILDDQALFGEELLSLALWMSKYYLCSLGEAIAAMLPTGKRESDAGGFSYAEEIPDTSPRRLSEEQSAAVEGIFTEKKDKTYGVPDKFHYLYGKTGSGKTEVFLQAAEKILNQKKGVIYLVPEIGLTHQVIEAVSQRFGGTVAVLHSGLTPSQKLSEWRRILNKQARIVIGARSAVFAPVPDLGIIIIDEEHDASYKSGTTPRYHARQAAMFRSTRLSIPLVMGSATPSVEAWHLMQTGAIRRHVLTKRLAGGDMPDIRCVDLSKQKISGCISNELAEEIRSTIENKRQVILFLNRRGFTHFFRCQSCGYEMICKNCSVPLTYHKNENRLMCHYCGWSTEVPGECPRCSSFDVGYSGFGTEFIEAEVRAKFPAARIVRVDTDSLTKKGELQEKLTAFKNGDFDIMLGTQMVAKGLNFLNLQLVGIVLADTGLHLPDFRASERVFSLITQVAGRAGRFSPDGKVIVQTYNPDRAPIYHAVNGNIEKFYLEELEIRKALGFPPYSRLIRLVFRSPSKTSAENASEEAFSILENSIADLSGRHGDQAQILGPSECPIEKIAMNYRYQILLKGKNISSLQKLASHLLNDFKRPQEVYIEADVDPVNLL